MKMISDPKSEIEKNLILFIVPWVKHIHPLSVVIISTAIACHTLVQCAEREINIGQIQSVV